MTLRGQVLNTSMDLQIYLCLAHWFGRMTKEQFDSAIKVPKVLTLDEFFSPLPEEARPSEYYVEESLLDSLARLKSVTMLFYPTLVLTSIFTGKTVLFGRVVLVPEKSRQLPILMHMFRTNLHPLKQPLK